MKIEHGSVVTIDAIEWREPGWEFDHPSGVIRPFLRIWDDGRSLERVIEDVLIDVTIDECLPDDDEDDGGIVIASTLRRRFKEAMGGERSR